MADTAMRIIGMGADTKVIGVQEKCQKCAGGKNKAENPEGAIAHGWNLAILRQESKPSARQVILDTRENTP